MDSHYTVLCRFKICERTVHAWVLSAAKHLLRSWSFMTEFMWTVTITIFYVLRHSTEWDVLRSLFMLTPPYSLSISWLHFVCIWRIMLTCRSSGIASLLRNCTVNLWILLRNSAPDTFIFSVWIKPFPKVLRFLSSWLAISTSYCWSCLCLSVGLEGTDIFFFTLQQFLSVLSVAWLWSFFTQSFTSFLCLGIVILGLKPLQLLFIFWQKKSVTYSYV